MKDRIKNVLAGNSGMEGIQAAGLVLLGIVIIAVLVLFGERIKAFFDTGVGKVNQMTDKLNRTNVL